MLALINLPQLARFCIVPCNTATGTVELKEVTAVFVREADHINYLTIEDKNGNIQVLEVTDVHPFWVVTDDPDLERAARGLVDENGIWLYHENIGPTDNGFWVEAKDLREGDVFLGANGELSVVVSNERVELPDGVTVYNFTVEGNHNYFVIAAGDELGQTSVLVHNAEEHDLPELALRYSKKFVNPQIDIVTNAVDGALTNLKIAQAILQEGGPEVEALFDKWYDSHDVATVQKVSAYVDNIVDGLERQVNRPIIGNKINLAFRKGFEQLMPGHDAFVAKPFGIAVRTVFLKDSFFLHNANERINILIHELSHIYVKGYGFAGVPLSGLKDHGYWDPEYEAYRDPNNMFVNLNQQQKLENASTFEHFIADLIKISLTA